MKLTDDSLTSPALVTSLAEELQKVEALFARGPEEPLNFPKYFKNELSLARKAAIAAMAPTPPPQAQPAGLAR